MDDAWLIDGPAKAARTVVLAHGAGAPMDTPFMNAVARGLAAAGLWVVRFEFPYMAARRTDGKRRGPDRALVLCESWLQVIARLGKPDRLVIGGKSMGGRMASMVAQEAGVGGVLCLGYPFHPPGQPERLRVEHLHALTVPTLILQGERDTFGTREDVATYGLPPAIRIVWLPDGDHSFKPRKSSGATAADNMARAIDEARDFVAGL